MPTLKATIAKATKLIAEYERIAQYKPLEEVIIYTDDPKDLTHMDPGTYCVLYIHNTDAIMAP